MAKRVRAPSCVGISILCWSALAAAFSKDVHEELTRQALHRWDLGVVQTVIAANRDLDALWNKQDANHFNDCTFLKSSEGIRARHAKVVRARSNVPSPGTTRAPIASARIGWDLMPVAGLLPLGLWFGRTHSAFDV